MTLLACAPTAQAAPMLRLPNVWKIQPAPDSKTLPAAGAATWGEIDSTAGDWRNSPITKTGAAWAKSGRDAIHSLWYQQTVALPAEWDGRRVVADFRRIEGDAIVFVNGQRVQELLRPGGEVDISQAAWPGQENTLLVFVTRSYQDISRGFEQDKLRYLARQAGGEPLEMKRWGLGVTGPVTLIARPRPVALSDVFVQPSWRQKSLTLDVEVEATEATGDLVIAGDIFDRDNRLALTVRSAPFAAMPRRSRHLATTLWPNPIPWELEGGYLYTARVRLERQGKTIDDFSNVRFGFREIEIKGRELLLNGHPLRLRLCSLMQGGEGNLNALSFFRLIGYNAFIFQNNPNSWWRDWPETPLSHEEVLDEMDRAGLALSLPAPSINYVRGALQSDPKVAADYAREMEFYMRRYRNRPSVFIWTVGMNSYNPRSAIAPQGMGRRESGESAQAKAINAAVAIAHAFDPTRPAHSHADGGTGDISSANVYLNFAPLQEREEWPAAWAQSGDMPFSAIEFGQPYTANSWKGKRCFLTEYAAMYLGDRAYATEAESGLRKSIEYSLVNTSGHGAMNAVDLNEFPAYWDFQRLFVTNTNRAWRTWGVNGGWCYWVYDIGYGNPPGVDTKKPGVVNSRYRNIAEPVTAKPSWASPNFEIHQQANQPLLAYIAGAPDATDKTHAYFSRETIRKNIVLVWDGPGEKTLAVSWKIGPVEGQSEVGQARVTLRPGDVKMVPVEFAAPLARGRSPLALEMTAQSEDGTLITDSFPLQVFSRFKGSTIRRIAVYDPANLSLPWVTGPWLGQFGSKPTVWKPGDSLQDVDLLIVGREALGPGRKPPYSAADVARGLRVLVLEQKPEVWEGLGFRITDTMPRYVFKRDRQDLITASLEEEDFINWRGSPDLLPEGVTRPHDVQHAPKWTNRHAVASVALQIPETVGFTPSLACEFDMNYSPLLQMRYGAGQIIFCSLDLTGRVGSDPAATMVAHDLVQHLLLPQTLPPARRVQSVGDITSLAELQIEAAPADFKAPESSLILVGSGVDEATQKQLQAFVEAGGVALHLPADAAQLKVLGYSAQPTELVRAAGGDPPRRVLGPLRELRPLRSVGPNLLRWRDTLKVDAFTPDNQPTGSAVWADGLLLVRQEGKGQRFFCQATPQLLATRYADDEDRRAAIQTSVQRLRQLAAQIYTNAGVGASTNVMQRLTRLGVGPAFQTLGNWQALGPFPLEKDDGEAMLATKFPGEEDAIAGDTNPNTTYKRADGVALDWRKTVNANAEGFINLAAQLNSSQTAVAYLTKQVHSDKARTATLQVGADYRLQVWVNGQLVFRTLVGRVRANAYQVKVPLRAGDNVITMKVGSGSRGFGMWASLSTEDSEGEQAASSGPEVDFYHPLQPGFDPYEFHYW